MPRGAAAIVMLQPRQLQTLSMLDDGRGRAEAPGPGCGKGTAALEPGPCLGTHLQPPCEVGFIFSVVELRKLKFNESKQLSWDHRDCRQQRPRINDFSTPPITGTLAQVTLISCLNESKPLLVASQLPSLLPVGNPQPRSGPSDPDKRVGSCHSSSGPRSTRP